MSQVILRPRLLLGVATIHRPLYFAFAYRLDKRCRTYTGKTLEYQAALLIDLWELRGLNRDAMRAILADLRRAETGDGD